MAPRQLGCSALPFKAGDFGISYKWETEQILPTKAYLRKHIPHLSVLSIKRPSRALPQTMKLLQGSGAVHSCVSSMASS